MLISVRLSGFKGGGPAYVVSLNRSGYYTIAVEKTFRRCEVVVGVPVLHNNYLPDVSLWAFMLSS